MVTQPLRELTCSTKLLFTLSLIVLGVGYAMAMIYVFASHAGRDGNPGLSVDDLIIAYSGSAADTRLEAAIKGPMAGMLPDDERNTLIAWVRRGSNQSDYATIIAPIIDKRCSACHSSKKHNPHSTELSSYEDVYALSEHDTGMNIFSLIRVSHIHLFGITFIFFISGFIFSHALFSPLWLKHVIIATPFIAILFDIASWYLTKLWPGFAWVVMISGGFMGVAFAAQWITSVWQMWFGGRK